MAGWSVRYIDKTTNREVHAQRLESRDQAIALALDRERDGCVIHSIVGPSGEEQWSQARAKT
jgi:hypothetical protein